MTEPKPMQLSIEDEKILNSPEYRNWRAEHIEDAVNEYLKRAKAIVKPSVTWLESVVNSTNLAYYKEYILPHQTKTPENPPEKRREKSIMFHTSREQVYGIDNADFSELPRVGETFNVHDTDYEVVNITTGVYAYPKLNLEQVVKKVELREKSMCIFTYVTGVDRVVEKKRIKPEEVNDFMPNYGDAIELKGKLYIVTGLTRGDVEESFDGGKTHVPWAVKINLKETLNV